MHSREQERDGIADLFAQLWPLPRSLTGEGVRQTHAALSRIIPLQISEIPSGTAVFDWKIPQEWKVRDAYVITPTGERILDFHDNPLHLVGYSVPFQGRLSRQEFDAYLHSRDDLPDAIPYVTSYYAPRWGFCIADRQRRQLPDGEYEVVVDTELFDGSLTLSEAVLPGSSEHEVLFSCYTCHPGMANDELTGPIVLAYLYQRLHRRADRRLTYRFVFLPETIGSLAYLSMRGDHLKRHLVAGYVATNLGRAVPFHYKASRSGDGPADHVAHRVLATHWPDHIREPFSPVGSDERQYCSPGFDLPVGVLRRGDTYFKEYHTSLDNRKLICFDALQEAVDALERFCTELEDCRWYLNVLPYGEPQLGRRGLYHTLGRTSAPGDTLKALMWLLNQSDGRHDLVTIADRANLPVSLLAEAADAACEAGILKAL